MDAVPSFEASMISEVPSNPQLTLRSRSYSIHIFMKLLYIKDTITNFLFNFLGRTQCDSILRTLFDTIFGVTI